MFRSLPAGPQKPDVRLAVADQIPDYTILICDKGVGYTRGYVVRGCGLVFGPLGV